jgi:hypothetical protein
MDVAFGAADIERWAAFSGDYNPVHFEREKALSAGADDIIVHGMLVLLAVKQELHDRLAPVQKGGDWLRMKAWLRMPVQRGQGQSVEFRQRSERRMEFRVSDRAMALERLRGFAEWFRPPSAHADDRASVQPLSVRPEDILRFLRDFPYVRNLWVWLDAVTFAQFVRFHVADTMRQACDAVFGPAATDADSSPLVLQTSQQIVISPTIASITLPPAQLHDLRYEVTVQAAVPSGAEIVGTVQTRAWLGEELATTAEYGLLMRKPLAASDASPQCWRA